MRRRAWGIHCRVVYLESDILQPCTVEHAPIRVSNLLELMVFVLSVLQAIYGRSEVPTVAWLICSRLPLLILAS